MSFLRYPEYKDSGEAWIGDIPAHWDVGPYKSFVDIQNGADHKAIVADEGYPVIGSGGPFAFATDFMFDGESVLLGRKGTIDRPLFVSGRFWVVDTMYWTKVLADADARFAYYTALTIPFGLYSTSTALPSMTKSALSAHRVVVPSLPEQRAIAAFLDRETAKIDALVAEQERLITLLKEKRQAVISHAVTKGLNPDASMKDSGLAVLGAIPTHWTVSPIGARYSVQLGKMLDTSKVTGRHLRPYLRVADVQWGRINVDDLPQMDFDEAAREKFRLLPGDLLVNEGGSFPGRTAVWEGQIDDCYYQKALHRLRSLNPAKDSSRFMLYLMEWACALGVFSAGGNEATIEHLPAEKLRRYRFAFPGPAEQRQIVEYLDAVCASLDRLADNALHAIELMRDRRSALITAAVTGQIDVRGLASAEAA